MTVCSPSDRTGSLHRASVSRPAFPPFRLVGIRTIIKIPDDLLSQGVKRFCFVHFFHGIHDNITGNDLIFPAGIKIALKSFLIERQQMDPQDLLSLEFRIILNILDHKPDQIQKFLSPDKKVHAHHHIKMADQLSGIVSFTLELKNSISAFWSSFSIFIASRSFSSSNFLPKRLSSSLAKSFNCSAR